MQKSYAWHNKDGGQIMRCETRRRIGADDSIKNTMNPNIIVFFEMIEIRQKYVFMVRTAGDVAAWNYFTMPTQCTVARTKYDRWRKTYCVEGQSPTKVEADPQH